MRAARALVVVGLLLAAGAGWAQAASLASVRERGTFNICAHPDALPYSSQDRTTPGFQLEIAEAIAKQLGVGMRVDWIVFTRHARRLDCDASIGTIVKADDGGPRRGPRLTKPYVSSGYVLVLPAASPTIARLEDVKGKIAVEHTSWPHYVLDMRKVPVKISQAYVPERDFRWNVAVGLRNADPPLVDAVNRAIEVLIADQTIPKIFARYGIAYRPPVAP